ncbi:MAG: hypothetical protein ACM3MK_13160 [Chitinophagales bacterium]
MKLVPVSKKIIIAFIIGVLFFAGLVFLPDDRIQRSGDLNQNGNNEVYILSGERLSVKENGKLLWESPPAWKVTAFTLGDATNDGRRDLAMVVWKRGSFGHHRPFWIKKDQVYSNHLFLYDLSGDHLRQVWLSSALDRPIDQLLIIDINNDSENELKVRERAFLIPGKVVVPIVMEETIWKWETWGFSRLR